MARRRGNRHGGAGNTSKCKRCISSAVQIRHQLTRTKKGNKLKGGSPVAYLLGKKAETARQKLE